MKAREAANESRDIITTLEITFNNGSKMLSDRIRALSLPVIGIVMDA
jgi:hypothetical protein